MTLSFLDRFRPQPKPPLPQVFEGLAQVRAYWEGLRTATSLPARSALDPRGLSGMLDRVFLAERIGRGLAQVRIAGSGIAEFAGTDVRGLPLSCLFATDSRNQLGIMLDRAFETPAVVELDLGSDRAAGGALVARMLLLPLAIENGANRVLGAISFTGPNPARCKLQLRSWRDERLLRPDIQPEPVEAPIQPIRRYGHLSLVHTAD